mmetsp:Transcript_94430/g.304946  ORF Transcript_94430/g.304946 Transcript_94430/m.304946 type:complete len:206 (+) Transcript_94430:57-674(+)
MVQPLGRNKWNDTQIWRNVCVKDIEYAVTREEGPPQWPPPAEGGGACYRVPVPGDRVVVSGMRSRPELNGAQGRVLSSADAEGFVRVRILSDDQEGGGTKEVKLLPGRLRPLGGGSSAPCSGAASAFSRSSSVPSVVSSRSLARSCSSGGSRRLGSAISSSARSTVAGAAPVWAGAGQPSPSGTMRREDPRLANQPHRFVTGSLG